MVYNRTENCILSTYRFIYARTTHASLPLVEMVAPSPFSSQDREQKTYFRKCFLEILEDRTLLSNSYLVNQLGDAGKGTTTSTGGSGDIRFCVNQANLNPGSTITFDPTALFGTTGSGTISLTPGELPINADFR